MPTTSGDPGKPQAPKGTPVHRPRAKGIVARKRKATLNDLEQALRKLERREKQTAILAALGHTALSIDDLPTLFDQAVIRVAEALENKLCKVLKVLPDGNQLLLVAGIGWKKGLVGEAVVSSGLESQAGYALKTEGPVIVDDLRTERRFSAPPLLMDHGVVSGVSVIIGPLDRPWGVLGTHSTERMKFTNEDANFVQAVANILWEAIERKRTEDSLREADRRKDQFLAMLAHELRNPLASISTALDITRITDDVTTVAHSRAIVERQVDHLTRLVDDLLEVSRITQGRLRLRKSRVALADLIEAAVADAQHLVSKQKHALSVSMPDDPIYLDADPIRLGQVFANLLANAAKYTPEGGRIRISVERLEGGARVSIIDNGIGIPPEQLGSIFEMFAGYDRSAETTGKGLGIGLSLVKSLTELHGGKVEAHSDGTNRGSEFIVWLPTASRSDDKRPDSAPGTSRSGTSSARRVLVVEDNNDAANSLAKLLELLGHEAQIAYDGFEALRIADEFRPHLVLLDIGLPNLNGYDVARRIRQQPWSGNVVLAAVTGWGQEHDRDDAMAAGIDRHVTKPLTLPVLKDILAVVKADESDSSRAQQRVR